MLNNKSEAEAVQSIKDYFKNDITLVELQDDLISGMYALLVEAVANPDDEWLDDKVKLAQCAYELANLVKPFSK